MMGISIGGADISSVSLGGTDVTEISLGSSVVWSSLPSGELLFTTGTVYVDLRGRTSLSREWEFETTLKKVVFLPTINITNMSYMFSGCSKLTSVNLTDCSSVTDADRIFYNCPNLRSAVLPGLTTSFDLRDTKMGRNELNTLFESLGQADWGADFSLFRTPGGSTCNRSIATNKGWTIYG